MGNYISSKVSPISNYSKLVNKNINEEVVIVAKNNNSHVKNDTSLTKRRVNEAYKNLDDNSPRN